MRIVAIDTETAHAAWVRPNYIVEIALVVFDYSTIKLTYSTLVNPGQPITRSKIHGITDAHVAGAPKFADISSMVLEILEGADYITGHNIRFDTYQLRQELYRCGKNLPNYPIVDTMYYTKGKALGGNHRALDDAMKVVGIIQDKKPRVNNFDW